MAAVAKARGLECRLRLAAAVVLAAPWAAQAQGGATVRMADHPGFGRIVFEFPAPVTFNLAVDGDRVMVVFDGAPAIGAAGAPPPRNVRSVTGGQGAATLVLSPGARARSSSVGNRVVIDVLDPVRTARAAAGRGVPRGAAGPAVAAPQDVAAAGPPGMTGAPAADAAGIEAPVKGDPAKDLAGHGRDGPEDRGQGGSGQGGAGPGCRGPGRSGPQSDGR